MRQKIMQSLFALTAFVAATLFVATAATSPVRTDPAPRLQGYALVLAGQTASRPASPDPAGDCLMRYALLKAKKGPHAALPEDQFNSLCASCRD